MTFWEMVWKIKHGGYAKRRGWTDQRLVCGLDGAYREVFGNEQYLHYYPSREDIDARDWQVM